MKLSIFNDKICINFFIDKKIISLKIDAYVIINLFINFPFDLHSTIWNIRENKMKYNFKSDWKMNIYLSKRNNCIKIEEIKFYYEEFIDKISSKLLHIYKQETHCSFIQILLFSLE